MEFVVTSRRVTFQVFVALGLVGGGALAGAGQGSTGTVDPIPLPPLAVVEERPSERPGWEATGRISGNLETAQRDFAKALGVRGWKLGQSVPLDHNGSRAHLSVWTYAGREILVMVWQKSPGQCGFSWGGVADGAAQTKSLSSGNDRGHWGTGSTGASKHGGMSLP
jgi:hypothetical protein